MTEDLQRFQSTIWFGCPRCNQHVSTTIEVPEPDWADMEKSSDAEGSGFYDVECPECHQFFNASVENYGGNVEVKLVEHPKTSIDADTPYFSAEPTYDEDPPDDPHRNFCDACAQISHVLEKHGDDENGYDLINRMCFVQYVSAFEAYLAETLVINVDDNKDAMLGLLQKDRTLGEERLSLQDVLKDPDIVRLKIRSYLRSVVYHHMGQVHALYGAALNISVIRSKNVGDALVKMMEARHDCVHRNGLTLAGERNTLLNRYYVKSCFKTMKSVVESIQQEIDYPDGEVPF